MSDSDSSDTVLPVAVDAMGGDDAPGTIIEGARLAAERFGVEVILVGRPDEIGDVGSIPVYEASEVVGMDAEPASAVRRMKDSSIVRAAELVRDGEASALLSAGNTGAAMAASLLRLGRIKGVSRPAIAVPFPVLNSTPSTLLDCGANADCQPEWLVQFAQLGTAYARRRFDLPRPRVGILTIGEEAGKGNTMVKAACELLEEGSWADGCDANYVGNVEGSDVMMGVADVIVCDGFTGNIVLKSLEGLFDIFRPTVEQTVAKAAAEAEANRNGNGDGTGDDSVLATMNSHIDPMFEYFSPYNTGAAMLLGTRGVSVISHGSSSPETISNAIKTASGFAADGLVSELAAAVQTSV